MAALYPISVAAEDFKVGDNVKWFTSSVDVSPYVGKVVAISPKTYKVWVTWPIGETQQHAPEELILVPKYQGMSVVQEDNGYDSYDKQISAKTFGTLNPSVREKAAGLVASNHERLISASEKMASFRKNAEELAVTHSETLAGMLMSDACDLKKEGKTAMQAYDTLYNKHSHCVPDELIKQALTQEYKEDL